MVINDKISIFKTTGKYQNVYFENVTAKFLTTKERFQFIQRTVMTKSTGKE